MEVTLFLKCLVFIQVFGFFFFYFYFATSEMKVPQIKREIKPIEKRDFMPRAYKRSKTHLVTARKNWSEELQRLCLVLFCSQTIISTGSWLNLLIY